jgi:hypothetical protein
MEYALGELGETEGLDYARLQANRARLAQISERDEEARRRWSRAIATTEALDGHGVTSAADLRLEYARFLLEQDDARTARRVLVELERELLEEVDEDSILLIQTRIVLGEALIRLDRSDAALGVLDSLVPLARAKPELAPQDRASLNFLLARALWTQRPNDRERAWQLAVTARDQLREHPDLAPDLVGSIATWLEEHGPHRAVENRSGEIKPERPAKTEGPAALPARRQ